MKQEKSKGLAYALEVLLFPFGLSWFYLDQIVHGIIHFIFGTILGVIIFTLSWRNMIMNSLRGYSDESINVLILMAIIYLIWFAIDCYVLNVDINEYNQKVAKENKTTMSLLSKIGGPVSEGELNTTKMFKTKVEDRQEIDNKIMEDVIKEYYKDELFQKFKNNYFKLTNNISDNQIKRSFQLIEDEQYEIALKYFEDLLVDGKESSFVYLGRALATLEINTPEKILYYYQSLQKNNDFRRGEYIEDEGHELYEQLIQLIHEIKREYSARIAYQDAKKDENKLSYDQLMELLLLFKDKIEATYFNELKEKREHLYNEAQELEQAVEHQKKKSKIYKKIYQNYAWCGKYKDAENKAESIKELYDQALQKEKRAKKRNYILIGIVSTILLVVCILASIFGYRQFKRNEAIKSLDMLSSSDSAVVRKFCRDNNVKPTDFVWCVNTVEYSDGNDNTTDIAYDPIPSGTNLNKSARETYDGKDYYIDSTNSSEWDTTDDSSSYEEE